MMIYEENRGAVKFSVLMSVYYKENDIFFRQAVESVINQTVKPDEIVIVKDGILTQKLEETCSKLQCEYPQYIRFVQLKKNMGLGVALQNGVLECRNELIARMDTDDIAKPDRFEKQVNAFLHNPNISVCGGYIEEFSESINRIDSIRKVPLSNDDIYSFGKKRNPFNHMTVMFKRNAVLKAGNYQPFHLLEDYYLWFRMIMNGNEMMNLSTILVSVRGGKDMMTRRGGMEYFRNEKKLYDVFRKNGYINLSQYMCAIIIRCVSRLMPRFIRGEMYSIFLR